MKKAQFRLLVAMVFTASAMGPEMSLAVACMWLLSSIFSKE